jgi:hypothetical protein
VRTMDDEFGLPTYKKLTAEDRCLPIDIYVVSVTDDVDI